MKTNVSLLSALIVAARDPTASFAVTHDDSEYIIPEFFIMFKGNGGATPSLTVTYDAYQEWDSNANALQEYIETTTLNGSGTAWASNTLIISKGMPLDAPGVLKIEGVNVAEYKIFINTPDTKYVPCAWAETADNLYLVTERYMISNLVSQLPPFPHTNYVFFKRAGEAGELPGKASSAMPGWRDYKMSLGS